MEVEEDLFVYYLKLTAKYNQAENWTEETYTIIQEHAAFIDSLGREGHLIFAGRTRFDPGDANLFGIALLRAASLEKAEAYVAKDPAVLKGIQEASVYPFSMGIRYFENLI